MDTILVLTDFSETACHAARYATGLALQLHVKHLILYHAYEPVIVTPGAVYITQQAGDDLKTESMDKLLQLRGEMEKYLDPTTTINCVAEAKSVDSFINDISETENADMIVLGTTGKTGLEQKLVGSTASRVATKSTRPVLLVPGQTTMEPVQRILFAYDTSQASLLKAVPDLTDILNRFSVPLVVVNVDHDAAHPSPQTPLDTDVLQKLLAPYHPSFHYSNNEDTVAGIMEVALANQVSLIIVIPREHGFFEGLFHRSVTKKLAYHSSIPLLVLHERT